MPGIPLYSGKAQEPTSTDQDWVQRNRRICSKRGNFCGLQLYFSQYFGPELSAHPGCCSVWTRAAFPMLHVCIAWMETLKEQQLQRKWKGCTAWNSSDLGKTNLPKWARLQLKKKVNLPCFSVSITVNSCIWFFSLVAPNLKFHFQIPAQRKLPQLSYKTLKLDNETCDCNRNNGTALTQKGQDHSL